MSSFNKVYKVNSSRQLIDLNKNVINFKVKFNTQGVFADGRINNNCEYYMLIVNQTQLDSPDFEKKPLKKVVGSLGGEIISNKNVYQNYFLLLEAKSECYVKVNVVFTKLANHIEQMTQPKSSKPVQKPVDSSWKRNVWIGVGVIAAALVFYYLYNKYKPNKSIERVPLSPKSQGSIESNFSDKTEPLQLNAPAKLLSETKSSVKNIAKNITNNITKNIANNTSRPSLKPVLNTATQTITKNISKKVPSLLSDNPISSLNLKNINLSDLDS